MPQCLQTLTITNHCYGKFTNFDMSANTDQILHTTRTRTPILCLTTTWYIPIFAILAMKIHSETT